MAGKYFYVVEVGNPEEGHGRVIDRRSDRVYGFAWYVWERNSDQEKWGFARTREQAKAAANAVFGPKWYPNASVLREVIGVVPLNPKTGLPAEV